MFLRSFVALFCMVLLMSIISCGSDKGTANNESTSENKATAEINIRLAKDPKVINPFFSPTDRGRQIYQYIYLPMADYHPETLKLHPILITAIPEGEMRTYKGEACIAYDIEIRPEANWSDGQPITNADYAFTIKMIKHPQSKITAWKPYFEYLKDVTLDPDNNKRLTVYFDKTYMLSKEIALTIFILPSHVFDDDQAMADISISSLSIEAYNTTDSTEIKVLDALNTSPSKMLNVVQAGPYQITAKETNQYYILDRIKNHWTKSIKDNPALASNLSKMTFKIVPDEVTAITMAKEGTLDLMKMTNSQTFLDLKEKEGFNDKWSFHTPIDFKFYYLSLNNKSPILKDKKVRQALAHLADIDDYIENIDGGLGIRTTGTFHPTKSYYDASLKPKAFDIKKAKALLTEAGWLAGAGGIRQKIINGKTQQLEFDIITTGSALGSKISLLLQEATAKAGIKLNVISKKFSLIRKEHLNTYNYDMTLLVTGQDCAPDDPYNAWHSTNAREGRRNVSGYNNPTTDKYIDALRLEREESKRDAIYKNIQAEMYEDQPVVFLYCPMNKIIISNKFKATTTSKRPGYQANSFKVR